MKKILLLIMISIIWTLSYKVKALTLTNEVQKNGDTYMAVNQGYDIEQSAYTIEIGKGSTIQEFNYTFTNVLNTQNSDYATFSVILGIPQDITITNQEQIDYDYCHRWNCTTFASNGSCQVFTCNQLYTNTDTTTHYTPYQYEIENLNIYGRVYYENNTGWASCSWQENELVCPTNGKKIQQLRLQVLFNPTRSSSIKIGVERGVNFWKAVNIQGAIQNQTNEIINQNATYQDSPTNDLTNQTQEFEQYEQAESNLMESLDFSVMDDLDISIDSQAASYIWNIVDRLRGINPGIITLMTSILGLGIIKMILNR